MISLPHFRTLGLVLGGGHNRVFSGYGPRQGPAVPQGTTGTVKGVTRNVSDNTTTVFCFEKHIVFTVADILFTLVYILPLSVPLRILTLQTSENGHRL